jgi:hypothetical protein
MEQPEFTAAMGDGAEVVILPIVYSPTVSMACLAETRLLYDYDDAGVVVLRTTPSYATKLQTDTIFHRYMLFRPLFFFYAVLFVAC